MTTYIIRRLLLMFPTLIGITIVVFSVMAFAPGGIVPPELMRSADGGGMRPEEREALKRELMQRYRLDAPLYVQYATWLNNVSPLGWRTAQIPAGDEADSVEPGVALSSRDAAHVANVEPILVSPWGCVENDQHEVIGYDPSKTWMPWFKMPDLGQSHDYNRPVIDVIAERLPVTLLLNLMTIPLIYSVSILIGIYSARNRGKTFDVTSGFVLLGTWSIPTMLAGVMLIGYLANVQHFHWFPVGKLHDPGYEKMLFLPYSSDPLNAIQLVIAAVLPFLVLMILAGSDVSVRTRRVLAGITAGCLIYVLWLLSHVEYGLGQQVGTVVATLLYGGTISGLLLARNFHLPIKGALGTCLFVPWAFWLATQMQNPAFSRGYLLDTVWHLILPVLTLTYGSFAFLSKLTRTAVLENSLADFARTARAKGVSENAILWQHVFRNSLLPLITVASSLLPALLTGSVIVEQVFSIDGMGKLAFEAALNRDREMILSVTLVGALLTLVGYLIADIFYAIADPRVSYD
ncbi:MAG: ABC transporter permease [Planctomycetota bacterium]